MVALGALVTERSEKVSAMVFAPLSVGKAGVTPQLERVAQAQDPEGRKLVRAGDVVINSRSDRRGAAGLSRLDGSVSTVYSVMILGEHLHPEYAHHLIRSVAFQDEFYRLGTGIVDDLWSTKFSRMSQIRVPLPSMETQRHIADYLDHETVEIDAMSEQLIELITALEERAHANCVRHLEKDEFHTAALASVANVTLGKMLDAKNTRGEPVRYLRAANITKKGDVDLDDVKLMPMTHSERVRLDLRRGDTLMIEGGDAGRVAFLPDDLPDCSFQKTVMRIRATSSEVHPRFLFLALNHAYASGRIAVEHSVSTIPHFTAEKTQRLRVPIPTLAEQSRIASGLDAETTKVGRMITEARKLQSLIGERRRALVTEVVTGRKEI